MNLMLMVIRAPSLHVIFAMILSLGTVFLSACSTDGTSESTGTATVPTEVPFTEVKGAYETQMTAIAPPQLNGVWRSEVPEPAGNGRYAIREFNITGSRWEMTYSLASGKDMKNVLFTHKASGTVTVQSPSKRIPGAYLIVFGFNHKSINIMTNDKITLKELGFDNCSISSHQEIDITGRGCGIIPRLGECPNDYDLLREEARSNGTYISIGNKFTEFSACSEDKRPVALGFSLMKVK